MLRIIAIDWSGAESGAKQKIWLAEVNTDDGSVTRLEAGRNRAEIGDHLLTLASETSELVVGLDFAFSLPAWFLEDQGFTDAPALWTCSTLEGERWLSECQPPFWGRPGTRRPYLQEHFRRTDLEVPAVGSIRPKSVFQIGGAGAVGTGSIRGMPLLQRLKAGGFSIWPFDPIQLPVVIEIYPRVLTGAVVKADRDKRGDYLAGKYPNLSDGVRETASLSEDAFDALVSALVMADHAEEILNLPELLGADIRREGKIWFPDIARAATPRARRQRDSSKTRVAPVFEELKRLESGDPQWVRRLLDLAVPGASTNASWHSEDLSVVDGFWGSRERCLQPPVALLSWMIRNFNPKKPIVGPGEVSDKRRKLMARDSEVIDEALQLLRTRGTRKEWHLLEGPTCPDALIVTPAALIVIEGKRTEGGPTRDTTYLEGRNQMLRHLDAAWEIRGKRSVYGILIVEAEKGDSAVPSLWERAGQELVTNQVVRTSLPHRGPDEQAAIAHAFLGVVTWQTVCGEFEIPSSVLLETVDLPSQSES